MGVTPPTRAEREPSTSRTRAEHEVKCLAMRLLFCGSCGSGWLPIVEQIAARLPEGTSLTTWDRRSPLTAAVAEVEVLLPSNAVITPDVVAAARRLRLIQQPAAGTDHIDRTVAAARDIPICNAPGANHVAMAEAALFLLLATARRAPRRARVRGSPDRHAARGRALQQDARRDRHGPCRHRGRRARPGPRHGRDRTRPRRDARRAHHLLRRERRDHDPLTADTANPGMLDGARTNADRLAPRHRN